MFRNRKYGNDPAPDAESIPPVPEPPVKVTKYKIVIQGAKGVKKLTKQMKKLRKETRKASESLEQLAKSGDKLFKLESIQTQQLSQNDNEEKGR